jgi:hypothetical protein
MKTAILMTLSAASIVTLSLPVAAETIVVDDQVLLREATVETPVRGTTMRAVEARFGAPSARHAAVGQPPITRWDYPGFSVYFEHQHVVHAVASSS